MTPFEQMRWCWRRWHRGRDRPQWSSGLTAISHQWECDTGGGRRWVGHSRGSGGARVHRVATNKSVYRTWSKSHRFSNTTAPSSFCFGRLRYRSQAKRYCPCYTGGAGDRSCPRLSWEIGSRRFATTYRYDKPFSSLAWQLAASA